MPLTLFFFFLPLTLIRCSSYTGRRILPQTAAVLGKLAVLHWLWDLFGQMGRLHWIDFFPPLMLLFYSV